MLTHCSFYLGKKVVYIYRAKTEKLGSKIRCIWGKVRGLHGTSTTHSQMGLEFQPCRAVSKSYLGLERQLIASANRQYRQSDRQLPTQPTAEDIGCDVKSDAVSEQHIATVCGTIARGDARELVDVERIEDSVVQGLTLRKMTDEAASISCIVARYAWCREAARACIMPGIQNNEKRIYLQHSMSSSVPLALQSTMSSSLLPPRKVPRCREVENDGGCMQNVRNRKLALVDIFSRNHELNLCLPTQFSRLFSVLRSSITYFEKSWGSRDEQ